MVPDGPRLETIQSNFISDLEILGVETVRLRQAETLDGTTRKEKDRNLRVSVCSVITGDYRVARVAAQKDYQRMSATVRPAGMNGSTCSV